jgi:hypothetical protein
VTHCECDSFAKRLAMPFEVESAYDRTSYAVCCWLLGHSGSYDVYVCPNGKLLSLKQSFFGGDAIAKIIACNSALFSLVFAKFALAEA